MTVMAALAQVGADESNDWWQASWVGNVITAIATIAGIGLTQYLANRREGRHRWTEKRLDAYAVFTQLAMEAIQFMEEVPKVDPRIEALASRFTDSRLAESLNMIRIIAPSRTYRACFNLASKFQEVAKDSVTILENLPSKNEPHHDIQYDYARTAMQEKGKELRALLAEFVWRAQIDIGSRTK